MNRLQPLPPHVLDRIKSVFDEAWEHEVTDTDYGDTDTVFMAVCDEKRHGMSELLIDYPSLKDSILEYMEVLISNYGWAIDPSPASIASAQRRLFRGLPS